MVRCIAALALIPILGTLACATARAETTQCTAIEALPATITTQGVYCLKQDLSTGMASGFAIRIAANNVTLDCNGWKLGGLAGGQGSTAYGIFAGDRVNVVVRNCNVRGFYRGIVLAGIEGGYHLVEDNRVDLSPHVGIDVEGDGSTIRGNRIYDTGPTPGFHRSVGIDTYGAIDIIDNTIMGVTAETTTSSATAWGIYSTANNGGEIARNRVSRISSDGTSTGAVRGIWANGGTPVIRDNSVINPGVRTEHQRGIVCNSAFPLARDNVVTGFGTPAIPISFCSESGNASN